MCDEPIEHAPAQEYRRCNCEADQCSVHTGYAHNPWLLDRYLQTRCLEGGRHASSPPHSQNIFKKTRGGCLWLQSLHAVIRAKEDNRSKKCAIISRTKMPFRPDSPTASLQTVMPVTASPW